MWIAVLLICMSVVLAGAVIAALITGIISMAHVTHGYHPYRNDRREPPQSAVL